MFGKWEASAGSCRRPLNEAQRVLASKLREKMAKRLYQLFDFVGANAEALRGNFFLKPLTPALECALDYL